MRPAVKVGSQQRAWNTEKKKQQKKNADPPFFLSKKAVVVHMKFIISLN